MAQSISLKRPLNIAQSDKKPCIIFYLYKIIAQFPVSVTLFIGTLALPEGSFNRPF